MKTIPASGTGAQFEVGWSSGGAYNYFKLRDLGQALGFNVDWSAETGISIKTK